MPGGVIILAVLVLRLDFANIRSGCGFLEAVQCPTELAATSFASNNSKAKPKTFRECKTEALIACMAPPYVVTTRGPVIFRR